MPALTRRRDPTAAREGWLIYFGDVRVGSIGLRAGVPSHAPQWSWSCGFHPGTDPDEHRSGIAETFGEARDAFQRAWQEIDVSRTEADYEEWRAQRDWTAWKYRMHNNVLPLPTQRSEESRAVSAATSSPPRRSAVMSGPHIGADRNPRLKVRSKGATSI